MIYGLIGFGCGQGSYTKDSFYPKEYYRYDNNP